MASGDIGTGSSAKSRDPPDKPAICQKRPIVFRTMTLLLKGTPLLVRRLIKASLYTPMALFDAFRIPLRKAQPRIEFTVEADPPSVYYNFRVKKRRLKEFERHLALPDNLRLTPIRCLDGEKADYLLTLNVYRVSGVTNGVRAEFSTYIADDAGVPRYMVVEARDHTGSIDPINIITWASRVEQKRDAAGMVTVLECDDQVIFRASAQQAVFDAAPYASIHGEWIAANDFIYWRNGVRDRCYYDSGMANPRVRSLDPSSVELSDRSPWAEYLEPLPKHVLVYENAIHLMIVPWENL